MLRTQITKKKYISILKDRFLNWVEKGNHLTRFINQDEDGLVIFMKIIEKHRDTKVRKSAASVIKYMTFPNMGPELITFLFKEKEWTVRYAIAKSCAHLMKQDAINEINKQFTELSLI